MTQQLEELQRLMLPDAVNLDAGSAAGPILDIDVDGHRARISLFGGQLISWQPDGHDPVLWLSDGAVFDQGTAIRGGIPVCWPWFGAHPDGAAWPSHGFARTTAWVCEKIDRNSDGISIHLALPKSETMSEWWPHASRTRAVYQIGKELSIELSMTNIDAHAIGWTQALHTYFRIGEIEEVAIHGLETSPFIDKLTDIEQPAERTAISIDREVDRIYRGLGQAIELHDPSLSRSIAIAHEGAGNAIVWNPWIEKSARLRDMGPPGAYHGMVCVETGTVAPDALTLEPGATHTLKTHISVRKHPKRPQL